MLRLSPSDLSAVEDFLLDAGGAVPFLRALPLNRVVVAAGSSPEDPVSPPGAAFLRALPSPWPMPAEEDAVFASSLAFHRERALRGAETARKEAAESARRDEFWSRFRRVKKLHPVGHLRAALKVVERDRDLGLLEFQDVGHHLETAVEAGFGGRPARAALVELARVPLLPFVPLYWRPSEVLLRRLRLAVAAGDAELASSRF